MSHDVSQRSSPVIHKPEFEQLLETREICRVLGISRPTFQRMIVRGELPVRKIGRKWKITPTALRDFIDGKSASK